jgi:hypothetical protein
MFQWPGVPLCSRRHRTCRSAPSKMRHPPPNRRRTPDCRMSLELCGIILSPFSLARLLPLHPTLSPREGESSAALRQTEACWHLPAADGKSPSPQAWQCPTERVAGHLDHSKKPPKVAEILAFPDCEVPGGDILPWQKECFKTRFSCPFLVLRCPAKKLLDNANSPRERVGVRGNRAHLVSTVSGCLRRRDVAGSDDSLHCFA